MDAPSSERPPRQHEPVVAPRAAARTTAAPHRDALQAVQDAARQVCRRLCVPAQEHADVVQDAVLVYLEKRPDLRPGATVFTWAWSVVYNRVRARRRRAVSARKYHGHQGFSLALHPRGFDRPDELFERAETAALVRAAIQQESPRAQAMLRARYFDDQEIEACVRLYSTLSVGQRSERQAYYAALQALSYARQKVAATIAGHV